VHTKLSISINHKYTQIHHKEHSSLWSLTAVLQTVGISLRLKLKQTRINKTVDFAPQVTVSILKQPVQHRKQGTIFL